jgi:hypothetical protein
MLVRDRVTGKTYFYNSLIGKWYMTRDNVEQPGEGYSIELLSDLVTDPALLARLENYTRVEK